MTDRTPEEYSAPLAGWFETDKNENDDLFNVMEAKTKEL